MFETGCVVIVDTRTDQFVQHIAGAGFALTDNFTEAMLWENATKEAFDFIDSIGMREHYQIQTVLTTTGWPLG